MGCINLLVFIQCCNLYLLSYSATIVTGPQDTDVIVGGNITLFCTVENLESNTVVWRRFEASFEYSKNRTVQIPSYYNGRYSVIGEDAKGTYNLYIKDVDEGLEGGQMYQCVIEDSIGTVLVASESATLSVHVEPLSPICNLDSFMDLTETEDVTFECIFIETTIPKVEMTLLNNNNILISTMVDPDLDQFTSMSSVSFAVTAKDDGAVVRCLVDHQIFQMSYECSLTLNVKHKPIVEITQMGTLTNGNASFTCENKANPTATEPKWSLCLQEDTSLQDCINDLESGILTISTYSEGMVSECEIFGSNVSCQVFKHDEIELPVYVVVEDDNLTIPENMTTSKCLLKCSVNNTIGVGNDNFTIDNAICLMAIEPTTVPPTTVQSTTMRALSTTREPSVPDIKTTDRPNNATLPPDTEPEGDGITDYYYVIGGLAGGTVVLFLITIVILMFRNAKSDDDESVTQSQYTQYPNTEYEDNGGFDEPKDTVIYSSDNPFKTFGKGNGISKEDSNDPDNIHDKNTLPMNGNEMRQDPEGEGKDEAPIENGGVDTGGYTAIDKLGNRANTGDSDDVKIDRDTSSKDGGDVADKPSEPQYAVVNKSTFGHDKPQSDELNDIEGVEYNIESNPYYEINHNRPSITQI